MADTAELRCEVVDPGPVAVVELAGPLRLEGTGRVQLTVRKLLTEPRLAIVLDVAGLHEIDDICVSLFPTVGRIALEQRVSLIVAAPSVPLRARLRPVGRFVNVVDSVDEAMLAAAERPVPLQRVWLQLRPEPLAPVRARRFVARACEDNQHAELRNDAVLVANELVSNAMQHGGAGTIELTLDFRRYYLRISVHDTGPPLGEDDYGYGLALVETLSASWGCTPDPDGAGKLIWADLPLAESR